MEGPRRGSRERRQTPRARERVLFFPFSQYARAAVVRPGACGAPCAPPRRATCVCVYSPTAMKAAAEEGKVPVEVLRALFAHGGAALGGGGAGAGARGCARGSRGRRGC